MTNRKVFVNYATAFPWLVLLGLFTGARLEELCQLAVADVRVELGVQVIDIHARNGNKLKNKSCARLVPLHPAIVSAGFLDYVAGLPATGKVFPGLKLSKTRAKYSKAVGQAFVRLRRRLGLTRKGLTFHSLRHNVGQALDRASVRESDAARVLGHKHREVTFGVYSKAQLERVKETVEKIRFPGLCWHVTRAWQTIDWPATE
jgi:integrase